MSKSKKMALKTLCTMAVLIVTLYTTASAGGDPRWEGKTPNPVKDFIAEYKTAYEQGDIVKFMTLFSISAIENGTSNYGQIAQSYEENFKKGPYIYDMSHIKVQKTDSTYTIKAHYTVTNANRKDLAPTEGYLTWLLITENTELKILKADYSTTQQPTAQAAPQTPGQPMSITAQKTSMVTQPIQQMPLDQIKTAYEKEQFSTMLKVLRESPTPIRTPDTIVRVFILPYTDFNDRLHGSTYTYLKIENGRWLLGDYLIEPKKTIKQITTPLEYAPMAKPTEQKQETPKKAQQPTEPPRTPKPVEPMKDSYKFQPPTTEE